MPINNRNKYSSDIGALITHASIEGNTWTDIGASFNIDRRTAKRWRDKWVKEWSPSNSSISTNTRPISLPQVVPERFTPMVAHGHMITTCDWHIPLHDTVLVDRLMNYAQNYNVPTLIIGGDFLNVDEFSSYPPHQPEANHAREKEHGREIMSYLLEIFDDVYLFWGNHEHRLSRATDFKHSFKECMENIFEGMDISNLHISDLDYMHLYQGDRKIRFCHQKNFSSVPLTVPRKLAGKYHCSIITAHSHHLAMGFALDGENWIMEGGGLYDKRMTEYIQRTTTHHEWVPGFIHFQDNVPTLLSPLLGNL